MIDLQIKQRFISINLKDLVEQMGEDATKSILSSFECPMNKDVEIFIRDKAIEFTKHGISSTHLVFLFERVWKCKGICWILYINNKEYNTF